ncbi:HEPN domain-containing protein [Salinibacter sp.]|uniref:HEPN domain-containing protein n=1 Tax=Salinibacter sp. TaxID=2065818 RepID=UPI0021E73C74|nr:HEPN domain-containing protein [Salinibacter sp.]
MSEVQERLQTARRRVEAAQCLHRNEFESDAINRLHFGVLESARALLLLRDLTPKTHKGTGMKLGQHFRNDVDVGLLTKLRQNRKEADYDLWKPSSDEVGMWLERADEFVDASAHIVGRE